MRQTPKERAAMVAKGYELLESLRTSSPERFSTVSTNGVNKVPLISFTMRIINGEIKAFPFPSP